MSTMVPPWSKGRAPGRKPAKFAVGQTVYSSYGARSLGVLQLEITGITPTKRGRAYHCKVKQQASPALQLAPDKEYAFYESNLSSDFTIAEKRVRKEITDMQSKIRAGRLRIRGKTNEEYLAGLDAVLASIDRIIV